MKLIELSAYLVYLSTYLIAVPILLGFYLYRRIPILLRILLAGLVLVLILDVALLFSTAKNAFLYVFCGVDVLLFGWIFSRSVSGKATGHLILAGTALVTLTIGLDAFFYSGLTANSLSQTLARAFLVVISVVYLSQLIQDLSVVNLLAQPMLWVSLGVLTYNAVSVFDAFSKPILSYSQNLYLQFYTVWALATMLLYGCYTYAFWTAKHTEEIS